MEQDHKKGEGYVYTAAIDCYQCPHASLLKGPLLTELNKV